MRESSKAKERGRNHTSLFYLFFLAKIDFFNGLLALAVFPQPRPRPVALSRAIGRGLLLLVPPMGAWLTWFWACVAPARCGGGHHFVDRPRMGMVRLRRSSP